MEKKLHDIEELVDRLEEQADANTLRALLEDEDMRQYASLLKDTGEAFACKECPAPDVAAAWEALSRKLPDGRVQHRQLGHHKKKWYLWGVAAMAAAACITILWWTGGYFMPDIPPTVATLPVTMQAEQPQNVVLTTERGNHALTGNQVEQARLTAEGIRADDKSIDYREMVKAEMQQLSVPAGQDFKVTLSDGTEVWLNAASRLSYPSRFTASERIVTLEGEAYFKVAKDNRGIPFIVKTQQLATRVTGTEFNVKAYTDELPCITLVAGSVCVSSADGSMEQTLKPGEEVRLEDGRLTVNEADTYACTQWKNGYFYFDDTPLIDVVHALAHWYGAEIEFADAVSPIVRIHYTASRHEGIDKALDHLNALGKVRASLENGKITIRKQ